MSLAAKGYLNFIFIFLFLFFSEQKNFHTLANFLKKTFHTLDNFWVQKKVGECASFFSFIHLLTF